MLSKNKIKYLVSLTGKKARLENSSFLVEGEKIVSELTESGFEIKSIFYTSKLSDFVFKHKLPKDAEMIEISESEALRISSLKTPPGIMAEVAVPKTFYPEMPTFEKEWCIGLDDIQDPGNLGTIIRTADWFGIKTIICSRNTVDVLNPKVLQSTMGAVFRVKICYTDLAESLNALKRNNPAYPILAAVLDGENIYKTKMPDYGILLMGNESKGLSKELIARSNGKIAIPNFGKAGQSSESLNVSIATGILISEIKRRKFMGNNT
jgi:RNA methyltransferase, TrmH family